MKTISAVRLVCAAALLAALCMLVLAGCARRADVCDVLAAALGSAPDRPEGTVYSTSAESDSPSALDSRLAAVLWGNGSPPPAFALVNSAAVFLPTGQAPTSVTRARNSPTVLMRIPTTIFRFRWTATMPEGAGEDFRKPSAQSRSNARSSE